jgi:hypothetical protein
VFNVDLGEGLIVVFYLGENNFDWRVGENLKLFLLILFDSAPMDEHV